MYRLLYGGQVLHDPGSDDRQVLDIVCNLSLIAASTLQFTVPKTNPLAGSFECMRRDVELALERDGEVVFRGRVLTTEAGLFGNEVVTAESERGYLNDILLPPFSTDGMDGAVPVPANPADLFVWFIQQYNAKQDSGHQLRYGVNQAGQLANNIQANEAERVTVWEAIKSRLMQQYGGWVRIRYSEGLPYIDYLVDSNQANAQKIEFGVNLLDYTSSKTGDGFYTRLAPISYNGETLAGLADGPVGVGLLKQGEFVVNTALESKYGIIEAVEYFDTENVNRLLQDGIMRVKAAEVGNSITIKAFDLALIDPTLRYISPGDYVRVVSPPHNLDRFYICWEREIHPTDPGQDTVNLGSTDIKLTTSQSRRLADLDSTISEVSSNAVTGTVEQFYQSVTSSTPTGGSWADTQPAWEDGKYIFRRTIVTYGNGTQETTPGTDGVCITGNTGEEGPQGPPGPGSQAILATSTTAAATQTKVATPVDPDVTISQYDGLTVAVIFQYGNTASSPQLTVGAITAPIYTNGNNEAWWTPGTAASFTLHEEGGAWQWVTVNNPVYASEATVGNPSAENVHLASGNVDICTGSVPHSRFASNAVSLGMDDTTATVDMCGQKGLIQYKAATNQLQVTAGEEDSPEDVVLTFPPVGGQAVDGYAGEFYRSGIPGGAVFEANNTVNSFVGTHIFQALSGRYVPYPLPLYKARGADQGATGTAQQTNLSGHTITQVPLAAGYTGEVVNNPVATDGNTYYTARGYFDFSNNGVKCLRAGVVFVFASVYISSGTVQAGVYVKQNGIEAATSGYSTQTGGQSVRQTTTVLEVAANDVLTLHGRASGSTNVARGNVATFLLVIYLG